MYASSNSLLTKKETKFYINLLLMHLLRDSCFLRTSLAPYASLISYMRWCNKGHINLKYQEFINNFKILPLRKSRK